MISCANATIVWVKSGRDRCAFSCVRQQNCLFENRDVFSVSVDEHEPSNLGANSTDTVATVTSRVSKLFRTSFRVNRVVRQKTCLLLRVLISYIFCAYN